MKDIFTNPTFSFPYDYHFPGQANDERILFITRENSIMLWLRRGVVVLIGIILFLISVGLISAMGTLLLDTTMGYSLVTVGYLLSICISVVFIVIGWWWVSTLWKKSLGIITTKRLIKFIYTTPANRHSLSLPLEMIVDTGSYTKGFIQAFLKLGTFTARSSASSSGVATEGSMRINKKYFYIENIVASEDLQHYVNKLLHVFRKQAEYLVSFRPFIPELKGEERKKYMEQFPEYWS